MSLFHIVVGVSLLSTLASCTNEALRPAEEPELTARSDAVRFYERPRTLLEARKSELPAPLVVFLERDPWAMVIGSDSPRFALYSDGTAIWRSGNEFREAKLSAAQTKALLSKVDVESLRHYYGGTEISEWTDQPEPTLLAYNAATPVFISIYGSLEEEEVRQKVPHPLLEAFDAVRNFTAASSRKWLPEQIEVMIWPYEHAREPSIIWPSGWPDISSPTTIKRGDDSYSLFLSSNELKLVQAFLKTRNPKGAVEIDGRKWSTSIRYPFPHEQLWMPPNPELAKPD